MKGCLARPSLKCTPLLSAQFLLALPQLLRGTTSQNSGECEAALEGFGDGFGVVCDSGFDEICGAFYSKSGSFRTLMVVTYASRAWFFS